MSSSAAGLPARVNAPRRLVRPSPGSTRSSKVSTAVVERRERVSSRSAAGRDRYDRARDRIRFETVCRIASVLDSQGLGNRGSGARIWDSRLEPGHGPGPRGGGRAAGSGRDLARYVRDDRDEPPGRGGLADSLAAASTVRILLEPPGPIARSGTGPVRWTECFVGPDRGRPSSRRRPVGPAGSRRRGRTSGPRPAGLPTRRPYPPARRIGLAVTIARERCRPSQALGDLPADRWGRPRTPGILETERRAGAARALGP